VHAAIISKQVPLWEH